MCLLMALGLAGGCRAGDLGSPSGGPEEVEVGSCVRETTQPRAVQRPRWVRNINVGQTGWFASPAIVDLDDDGQRELVAPLYETFVFDAAGRELARGNVTPGRIFSPPIIADLDRDGVREIVVGGREGAVAAYEWRRGRLALKNGWPASTCSAGECPETRGLAAADLDGNGRLEVVATTTNSQRDGAQVFVFNTAGSLYQPRNVRFPAWPRFNNRRGTGGDEDFNGMGNQGAGCYAPVTAIANLDDDRELEIVVGNDVHRVTIFNHDGTSVLASDYYTNWLPEYFGGRLGWGQFIRWREPGVEEKIYHLHKGLVTIEDTEWLHWTMSPLSIADVDGDGRNDVVGVPATERYIPYRVVGYAFVAFHGAQDGGVRSARRLPGFEDPFWTRRPVPTFYQDYPTVTIAAPTVVQLVGDPRPEIVAPTGDGRVYAVSPDGQRLWEFDYARGRPRTYASEVVAADLNRDGVPELVFGTYGPGVGAGRLIVLNGKGRLLFEIPLPGQASNSNGVGAPAAPTIGDLDGDGQLEIVMLTLDHGIDVWTVPSSGTSCLAWPTARGSYLRNGTGPATVN